MTLRIDVLGYAEDVEPSRTPEAQRDAGRLQDDWKRHHLEVKAGQEEDEEEEEIVLLRLC